MVDLTRSSSLKEDPLHAYSGLSLFPRTLKSLSNPLPHCLYQSDDLQHTLTFLESMSFTTQEEHQEQAKAIIDNSSELLEQGCQGTAASVASEDMNVVGKMNPVPNKRERRPGLDRKRVHFCFKPTISQPPSNEPSFDGSKYPKPEDYFAAYERNKIAKREWQKQTGSSVTDAHQNLPLRRPRRQGIPGRKRGIYKHTYTDIYFTDAINLGTSEKENPIPSEQSLERTTTAHFSTADRDVDDLTVDTDKDLENILSELLACNKDELNGDDAVKLLEEHLQIKPIVVEKFTIPEFQDVKEMRLKASGRSPSNRKSVLSDIQNMLKGIHRDEVQKNRQSPTPVTNKDTSSSNPPLDQFSFPDSNHLLPGDQQSSEVASRFNSSFQKSSNEDDSHSHSGSHRSQSTTQDMNADNCVDNSITNRNSATPEVNDMQTKGNEGHVPMSETEANRNAGKRENDADINEETGQLDSLAKCASIEVARMDPLTVEEDSILYQQDVCSKSPNRTAEQCNTVDGSFEHAEYIQEKYGEVNDSIGTSCGLQVENVQEVHNSSHEQTNKRRKRGSCESNMRKRSKTVRGESEGDLIKTLSHESGAKKQIKRKSNEREEKKQMKTVTREGKIFSRRKSLAGAGTKWESGVRRSTRIKSRPLEYWRGERFLVGRIHESLATVIGIKYASPENGKTDKRTSKVKSYVSDEYKELVELAALH